MTQEHKEPANLPAAASHTPSSAEEQAASWAGDSKDFATLFEHLCWQQKGSPVLECVPKAKHKHSCLPLLQISLPCVLGVLAGDESLRQGVAVQAESSSPAPLLLPWHYKFNSDCFALLIFGITFWGPADSPCLLSAGECCIHFYYSRNYM